MEETKIYCDICREKIVEHDYSSSCLIKPYIHRNIVKDLQIDICPDCRDKIKDLNKFIANENFESNFALCFFRIIKKLI